MLLSGDCEMGNRVFQAGLVSWAICVSWNPGEGARGTLEIREVGVRSRPENKAIDPEGAQRSVWAGWQDEGSRTAQGGNTAVTPAEQFQTRITRVQFSLHKDAKYNIK